MHTYLSIPTELIPQSTMDNPKFNFWGGLFSNDGAMKLGKWMTIPSRILIDGRNSKGDLVHPDATFNKWLESEVDPVGLRQIIIEGSEEITKEQYSTLKSNPISIWYTPEEPV